MRHLLQVGWQFPDGDEFVHRAKGEPLESARYKTLVTEVAQTPSTVQTATLYEIADTLGAIALPDALAERLALEIAKERDGYLRVRIECESPLLRSQPWELLRLTFPGDPEPSWLALAPGVCLTRSNHGKDATRGDPSIRSDNPIRIGVIDATKATEAASPLVDLPSLHIPLDLPTGTRQDGVEVRVRTFPANTGTLRVNLEEAAGGAGRPLSAVVYLGHATPPRQGRSGRLHMTRLDPATRRLVGSDMVPDAFAAHVQAMGPQLVVLAACESAPGPSEAETDAIPGFVHELVNSHFGESGVIQAAVAMQHRIQDTVATMFLAAFLSPLTQGSSLEQALHAARVRLHDQQPGATWATPVLYLNRPNGDLWPLHLWTTDQPEVPPPVVNRQAGRYFVLSPDADGPVCDPLLTLQLPKTAPGESIAISADARVSAQIAEGELRFSWVSRKAVLPVGFRSPPYSVPPGARVVAVAQQGLASARCLVTTPSKTLSYLCQDGKHAVVTDFEAHVGVAAFRRTGQALWATPDGIPSRQLARTVPLDRVRSLDIALANSVEVIAAVGMRTGEPMTAYCAVDGVAIMTTAHTDGDPIMIVRPLDDGRAPNELLYGSSGFWPIPEKPPLQSAPPPRQRRRR